jgi:hypothetical protein
MLQNFKKYSMLPTRQHNYFFSLEFLLRLPYITGIAVSLTFRIKPVTSAKENIMKWLLLTLWTALLLSGCHHFPSPTAHDDDDDDKDVVDNQPDKSRDITITYQDLFPFENSRNWWSYSDEDGNQFSIDVIDTISDEDEIYYKVAFTEEKLNFVQDDWFRKEPPAVSFSEHLVGEYLEFLPGSFNSKGGSFSCGSASVSYTLLDSLEAGDKIYTQVVELEYSREILHGFDRIYFANSIGIVRMVDEDGRWPIDYTLDSARVGKTVHVF